MKLEFLEKEKGAWKVKLVGQDLGFATLLVEKLLGGKGVSFAAATLDHPLKGNPVVVVRAKDPQKEIERALDAVGVELDAFKGLLAKASA